MLFKKRKIIKRDKTPFFLSKAFSSEDLRVKNEKNESLCILNRKIPIYDPFNDYDLITSNQDNIKVVETDSFMHLKNLR